MTNEIDFDTQLDIALDEMPLAPLPDDFVPRLMTQITAVQQPEPFRPSLSDAVIPALLALLFAGFWLLTRMDVDLSGEAVRALLFSTGWMPIVILVVAIELAMGAILCFWLLGERPLDTPSF